jgi:hypothetical protein
VDEPEGDDGFVSVDDRHLATAAQYAAMAAERDVFRHSWLYPEPLVPPSFYTGGRLRLIAESCADCWGDSVEASRRLSPDLFDDLLHITDVLPIRPLDWLMRAIALGREDTARREEFVRDMKPPPPRPREQTPPSVPERSRRKRTQRMAVSQSDSPGPGDGAGEDEDGL